MKKISLFLAFMLCAHFMVAQTMTDDQIINFIMSEHQKGATEMDITTKLLKKGVGIDQIRKVVNNLTSLKEGAGLGILEKESEQRPMRVRAVPANSDYPYSASKKESKNSQLNGKKTKNLKKDNYIYGYNYGEDLEAAEEDSKDIYFEEDDSLKIFGHDIFNNELLTFEPAMNISLPATYVLGAGDQVIIDIWGASQVTIDDYISSEGYFVVEGVGPLYLAGKTLEQAGAYLNKVLGDVYSDSKISISIGKIRSIQVQVLGEVVMPGTYTLSALASAFNALYAAGGITDIGTLRNIKVYRGGKSVASIDVYDYILNGKTDCNIRLQDDDVISVGAYSGVVDMRGKVKRPMRYEVIPGETMMDVISYAGGFTGDAYTDNFNVTRKNGRQYSMHTIDKQAAAAFEMKDGDAVNVEAMLARYSNMIEVTGAVFYPGQYELGSKISTVKELVTAAGGVTEKAFMERAILQHRNFDNTIETQAIDIKGIMDGTAPDVTLRNNDLLYVPNNFDLAEEKTITVRGEVHFPGVYKFAENTSVKDIILQAGGFTHAASVMKIDVYRRSLNPYTTAANDTITESYSFSLKDGFILDGETFVLKPFDEVVIRKNPTFTKMQMVKVEGCVNFAGSHILSNKNYRLSNLINAAGGFTNVAYVKGASLYRKMTVEERRLREISMKTAQIQMFEESLRDNAKDLQMELLDSLMTMKLDLGETYPIAINLQEAVDNPGSLSDIVLRDGDVLTVPEIVSTIRVSGEVNYPLTMSYESGKNVKYYIKHAGGYSHSARKKGVYIVYMNGNVVNVSKSSRKVVEPGCEIVVPRKGLNNKMSVAEIAALGTSSASIATMIVAIINLLNK